MQSGALVQHHGLRQKECPRRRFQVASSSARGRIRLFLKNGCSGPSCTPFLRSTCTCTGCCSANSTGCTDPSSTSSYGGGSIRCCRVLRGAAVLQNCVWRFVHRYGGRCRCCSHSGPYGCNWLLHNTWGGSDHLRDCGRHVLLRLRVLL